MIPRIEVAETAFRSFAPGEIVKFTLIYDGPLPAASKKRANYAAIIRNELHPQMKDLWDHHVIMRQLTHEARVYNRRMGDIALKVSGPCLPKYTDTIPPLKEGQIDLCAPIEVPNVGRFLPIVRNSLYLACAIDILFLRHEEPLELFDGGGDLDNRIKCFFDALTIPNIEQANAGPAPCGNPHCCLLEDDRLISDFSIRTGRLLGKVEKGNHDVRIQAEITVKVLRVMDQNLCLVGG
jgi:hypothetical protein